MYVERAYLRKELLAMMKRRGVEGRWLKPAFDAQDIEWLIEEAPEAEVKPVLYGRWKDDCWMWHCNLCDKWFEVAQGDGDMNYCPNCGAKMEEGNDE